MVVIYITKGENLHNNIYTYFFTPAHIRLLEWAWGAIPTEYNIRLASSASSSNNNNNNRNTYCVASKMIWMSGEGEKLSATTISKFNHMRVGFFPICQQKTNFMDMMKVKMYAEYDNWSANIRTHRPIALFSIWMSSHRGVFPAARTLIRANGSSINEKQIFIWHFWLRNSHGENKNLMKIECMCLSFS